MEPKKKMPRIVSKRDYVRIQSIRAALAVSSVGLLLLVVNAPQIAERFFSWANPGVGFIIALLVIPLSLLRGTILRRARSLQKVVPLTRANTTRLPVDESLVRASEQPVQALQSVLLRPSSDQDTTPVEQLLRPGSENVFEEDSPQNRIEVRQ